MTSVLLAGEPCFPSLALLLLPIMRNSFVCLFPHLVLSLRVFMGFCIHFLDDRLNACDIHRYGNSLPRQPHFLNQQPHGFDWLCLMTSVLLAGEPCFPSLAPFLLPIMLDTAWHLKAFLVW